MQLTKATKASIMALTALSVSSTVDAKPTFTSKADPYDGSTTAGMMQISTHKCAGIDKPFVEDIYLSAFIIKDKDGTRHYLIGVDYWNNQWLFIGRQNSLNILIDGSVHTYSAKSVVQSVADGAIVHEKAIYQVDKSDIEQLSNANFVQFRLIGKDASPQRCMDAKALGPFREFLSETN